MVRIYRGYSIEVSSSGDHARVRLDGDYQVSFHSHTSYEDAKAWVDAEIAKGEE